MKAPIFFLFILAALFSCSNKDKSRYVPFGREGILDTQTGVSYEPVFDGLYELKEYTRLKIKSVVITDLIKGEKKEVNFSDRAVK